MVRAFSILFCFFLGTAMARADVRSQPWGKTPDGVPVTLFTLKNVHGMEVQVANLGGIVVSIKTPDRSGHFENVVQGYTELAPYLRDGAHYGALIGRYANRIAGASFVLNGKRYPLVTVNNANVQSHGGPNGYFRRVWDAVAADKPGLSLMLRLSDPDGEMGFPGTMQVQVRYSLTPDNVLRIEYRATTDKPTVVNLTNHSYFKLHGDRNGTIDDQILQIWAGTYLPTDATGMPTGDLAPVAGTDFDFRRPTLIGPRLQSSSEQMILDKGFDHTFVIDGKAGHIRRAAKLDDPQSGRTLEVWTSQPGVQLYTANSVRQAVRDSRGYVPHGAIAFEAQHFPNSPNQPNFPSTEITPATPLHEVTEFRFGVDHGADIQRDAH